MDVAATTAEDEVADGGDSAQTPPAMKSKPKASKRTVLPEPPSLDSLFDDCNRPKQVVRPSEFAEDESGDTLSPTLIAVMRRQSIADLVQRNGIQVMLDANDADTVPLQQQGDLAMYTDEAKRGREKLRQHADVQRSIRRWWHELGYSAMGAVRKTTSSCASSSPRP